MERLSRSELAPKYNQGVVRHSAPLLKLLKSLQMGGEGEKEEHGSIKLPGARTWAAGALSRQGGRLLKRQPQPKCLIVL